MSSKRTLDERLIEKNEQLKKAMETAKQYQSQLKQLEKRKKEEERKKREKEEEERKKRCKHFFFFFFDILR